MKEKVSRYTCDACGQVEESSSEFSEIILKLHQSLTSRLPDWLPKLSIDRASETTPHSPLVHLCADCWDGSMIETKGDRPRAYLCSEIKGRVAMIERNDVDRSGSTPYYVSREGAENEWLELYEKVEEAISE